MNRPKRTAPDKNQPTIVRHARDLGMVVWDTHNIGGEVLDILICWRGRCLPVEIKRPGHRDALTPGERRGIAALAHVGVQAVIAESIDDVLAAFEVGE